MVTRPVVVEFPLTVYDALEAVAAVRGLRPAAIALEIVRVHLLEPPPQRARRGHLRVLPTNQSTAPSWTDEDARA